MQYGKLLKQSPHAVSFRCGIAHVPLGTLIEPFSRLERWTSAGRYFYDFWHNNVDIKFIRLVKIAGEFP